MKTQKTVIVILLVLGMFFMSFGNVQASARTLSWVVSVTYQNVGDAATPVTVVFYEEGSATPITYDAGTLEAGAAASFYIGNVSSVSAGFHGNAILSAGQPLVATVVQFHQNATGESVKMRMLSNGFAASDGSNQYLIATALGNTFNRTTIFSIQNIETVDITATVNFYNVSNGSLANSIDYDIPANSSKYIELDLTGDTGLASAVFNGSVIISAVKKSDSSPANVVAAASELYTNKDVGANFEGVALSQASNKVYLATGLCQQFGLDTYYAVQNASLTDSAQITVEYYNSNGSSKATDGPYTIGPGQKKSIVTCSPSDNTNMTGFSGSAVITATNSASKIVAIGKAQAMNPAPADKADVFTIFMGEASGSSKIALPFVRWASDARFNASTNVGGAQRTFIAVQNLESTSAKVNVNYYGKDGTLIGTQTLTIPANAKGNTDASAAGALGQSGMNAGEFGYYTDGSFGGGVVIEAHSDNPTANFIAIARVQHPGAGEDYNGKAID